MIHTLEEDIKKKDLLMGISATNLDAVLHAAGLAPQFAGFSAQVHADHTSGKQYERGIGWGGIILHIWFPGCPVLLRYAQLSAHR
jgi:hypothetical protein